LRRSYHVFFVAQASELNRDVFGAAIEAHKDISLNLFINFSELKLTNGVSRLILPGANLE
jgi:hypothetical protein